ncbi:MAG: M24 family metallopeptidase [Paludibaculum sp.]
MRIAEIQQALREEGLDAWLFFDHHHRDPLAYRVLQYEPAQMVTRRWYYLIPAQGEPVGLVHRIESKVLGDLPGSRRLYAGWVQQREALATLLAGYKTVAMQYSPNCAVPYVANVDGGTLELVRATGVEIVTSANLIQLFEARCSEEQYESHIAAGVKVDAIRRAAFSKVSQALASGTTVTEIEIQQFLLDSFKAEGLFTDHGPIVGVNAHAADPHYSPSTENSVAIKPGDLLLIDLWAKFDKPGAIYYDITWTGFCGSAPTDAMLNVFAAVTGARDAAIQCVKETVSAGQTLRGFQVDDACTGTTWSRRGWPSTSSTAPDTPSAKKSTAMEPTWTTTRRTTSGWSSPSSVLLRRTRRLSERLRHPQRDQHVPPRSISRGDRRDSARTAAIDVVPPGDYIVKVRVSANCQNVLFCMPGCWPHCLR